MLIRRTLGPVAILAIAVASILSCSVRAQDNELDAAYVGVGFGQDMGGVFGFGVSYWPAPWLGAFVGGGWAIAGFSYQTGIDLRLPTATRTSPFITAMYGYNGAIHVEDLEKLDGVYTGPTIGTGLTLRQRASRNYWRFSINVPFRSQKFLDDWQAVKDRPDVEVKQDLLPLTFSVGFHFGL